MYNRLKTNTSSGRIRRTGTIFAMALLMWWVLTGGQGWWFGVPLAALTATAAFNPDFPARARLTEIPGFIVFFLKESIISGVDVARRVLGRRVDVAPTFIDFHFTLPEGSCRVFYINIITLLPGTMAVDIADGTLKVHILDRNAERKILDKLLVMEERVARLFSVGIMRRN